MQSDTSLRLQGTSRAGSKRLFDAWFAELAEAEERRRPVVYLWIGANIVELFRSFDFVTVYPEVTSLQTGVRKASMDYIGPAEEYGYSPDVCGYVKADVGLYLKGMEHPRGKIPRPTLVFNNDYCNTYLKWSEILNRLHGAPLANLSIPYWPRPTGLVDPDSGEFRDQRRWILAQLEEIVARCESVTGRKFDPDRLSEHLADTNRMADLWTRLLAFNRRRPAPFEAMVDGLNYLGIMNVFRGTKAGGDYLETVVAEIEERAAAGLGAIPNEKFRLVMDGTPCWFYFVEFVKLFQAHGAVFAFASYLDFTAGGWDRGFRHDPSRPLESLAEFLLAANTGRGFASFFDRTESLADWTRDYGADGIVFHTIKSCRLMSTPLADYREWLTEKGISCLSLESDVIDPRYYAEAQMKNRIEAFLETLDSKRAQQEARA